MADQTLKTTCETERDFNQQIRGYRAIAVFAAKTTSKDMVGYLNNLPERFKGANFVVADVDQLEPVAHHLGLADQLPAVIFYKWGRPKNWYYLKHGKESELEEKIQKHATWF